MAIAVEMPKMSDTMEEGVLVSWLVEEGTNVSAGDIIAQVETDKATMDLEVYDDGVLLKRVIGEGEAVPIGGLIAVLGKVGEDISTFLGKYQNGAGDGAAKPAATPVSSVTAKATTPSPESDARVKSSPLARKMAIENGLDLATVRGTGPEGRVIKRDVEALISASPAPTPHSSASKVPRSATYATPISPDGYEAVRISQMRKAISRRLTQSKFTAPHFYLNAEINMEKAAAFREEVNSLFEARDGKKVSFNDLVTKACALALRQHPYVNASYLEEEGEIRLHESVHVAIAVAVDEGLITPVIRDADRKGLGQIAEETRALATRARDRQLQPEEYTGSTFSTSNLGMFGIESFTAIINPPEACILAIGAVRDVPVVRDGALVVGKRMKVTLSCDHRVVDGAVGSRFLETLRMNLEEPLNLVL